MIKEFVLIKLFYRNFGKSCVLTKQIELGITDCGHIYAAKVVNYS